MYEYLDKIDSPNDLKKLSYAELNKLAEEIRKYILETTCITGGHVASSLGGVEIAIAIHYVFDSPKDRIVWDVGHQSYAHKIITGRRKEFAKIRTYKGISGFNNIFESPHDALTVGHAATSLSAALGMAIGRDKKGENFSVINVIGDGALTNGLIYEAFNNIAQFKPRLIIVLNDNKMSISENVGGISQYLNKLETTPVYTSMKNELWELLGILPDKMSNRARDLARRLKESLKNFFIPTILFEEFGIRYIGPINGHDLNSLISTLKSIKNYNGPIMLHAITLKGKGYTHAEENPVKFHGLGKFCRETGKTEKKTDEIIKYTDVFGKTLVELAKDRKDVLAITAAMPDGTGLSYFKDAYPERFFDVGIAESHAIVFAVGLSLQKFKPVCAIYSSFLQRCYDQLIHDVSLMKRNIFLVLDRAGLVGEDGPTHHGVFDISYLRTVPDMVIMSPKDEDELRSMVKLGLDYDKGPIALRYHRGEGYGVDISGPIKDIQLGKSEILNNGEKIIVLALGWSVNQAYQAAEDFYKEKGFMPTIVNMRFVKPFDYDLLSVIKKHDYVITVEDNVHSGGMGEMINSILIENNISKKIKNINNGNEFVEYGDINILRKLKNLDREGILKIMKEAFK